MKVPFDELIKEKNDMENDKATFLKENPHADTVKKLTELLNMALL